MAGSNNSVVNEWLEEERLILLESWARDGYTYEDIANRIGITTKTLSVWRKQYPEIQQALSKGREIVDYMVENALLKSALGYKTKEVKVTTIMRRGVVVEQQKEVLEKEQSPNVTACQVWLYNRKPDKWKKNRDAIIEPDEDTTVQITVVRAKSKDDEIDQEWQDEVNEKIEIRKAENKDKKDAKESKGANDKRKSSKGKTKKDSEDLDYWPDDWDGE